MDHAPPEVSADGAQGGQAVSRDLHPYVNELRHAIEFGVVWQGRLRRTAVPAEVLFACYGEPVSDHPLLAVYDAHRHAIDAAVVRCVGRDAGAPDGAEARLDVPDLLASPG